MSDLLWWQRGVIYQIYPRSFQDSDGDGVGDLDGIRSRLDHLTALGVEAVWLSPIFPSPMADFGYDVSDYTGIHPLFGGMADFDALLDDVHRRGLKLILDFVPNHSSSQHPWFEESRSSRSNPKRDWYLWRDPAADGGPPNNWISNFGGSAWQRDEATGQYYYHAFLAEQPDLNWRNPEVRAAMCDVLRFWLDKGVDGFRVDVIWHLMKDPELRDNPVNPAWSGGRDIDRYLQHHSADHSDIHQVVSELRAVLEEYRERVLIGEIYLPIERLVAYYGEPHSGAHLPFNFHLILTAWNAEAIARLIEEYEAALPPHGWPNWVIGNHDQQRIAARVGESQARIAAMLLLTLRGTPTLYYGDEIGLAEVEVPAERVQDPWEKNEPGLGFNRDPARTPMQWDGSLNAGFTSGEPWLPLSRDWRARNVHALSQDACSILSLHRRLIDLRRSSAALTDGAWRLRAANGDLLAYERAAGDERLLVALNFGHAPLIVDLAEGPRPARVLLSTHLDRDEAIETVGLRLRPDEGVVIAPTERRSVRA